MSESPTAPLWVAFSIISILVSNVSATCVSSTQEITQSIKVLNETVTDVVILNITNSPGLDWTFDISSVDNVKGNYPTLEQELLGKRINKTITDTELSLTVVESLNKEFFCSMFGKELNSFMIEITCKDSPTANPTPVTITVVNNEVNEKPPTFNTSLLDITIPESTPVYTPILLINNTLKDEDCPKNIGLNIINLRNYTQNPQVDGAGIFKIRLGSIGDVVLSQKIDFDEVYKKRQPVYYMVMVEVVDPVNRTATAPLRINIKDVNDLPPVFGAFQYQATTDAHYRGLLNTSPYNISAHDGDSLNCPILYSIVEDPTGGPSQSFDIDRNTGQVTQIGDLASEALVIRIKATEDCPDTPVQESTINSLLITLGNQTIDLPSLATGKSTAPEQTDFQLILIIIGVVALVIIAAFIVGFIIYHRRMKRAISPDIDRPESPHTEEEELDQDTERSGSKEVLLDPMVIPTPAGRNGLLPPLNMKSTGTETEVKKKRSRRRKKVKEPEIYDGTREYDMAADPTFFNSGQKEKIKRSTRSKENKTTEPNRRITVKNDDD